LARASGAVTGVMGVEGGTRVSRHSEEVLHVGRRIVVQV
jgi:hypothetical protein